MSYSQNVKTVRKPWRTYSHMGLYPPTTRLNYRVTWSDQIVPVKRRTTKKTNNDKGNYKRKQEQKDTKTKKQIKRVRFN